MTVQSNRRSLSRRDFLKLGAGAALAATGAAVLPRFANKVLTPSQVAQAADAPPDLYWAGTDGWIYLPPDPPIGFYHPDSYAPAPFTTYIFGFRNITGLDSTQMAAQKNKAQHSAPLFWVDEYQDSLKNEFRVQLTNLGLAQRPDLTDSHTLHWHGFRNVIPYYDGEPTGSVSVPIGRNFTYVFRPRDPGTYMYHCHVEDVEHVHMGMTGPVFVRPKQNGNTGLYPSGKFAYNDGDGSTGYDREFVMFLSEVWAEAHWADAHIQLPDWSDYHADFSLLNGRVYPYTLAPNAPVDPSVDLTKAHAIPVQRTADGDLVAPGGHPELQYQPLSALVTCQPGERVLLRFSNLGFREAAMTLAGIKMKVIGRDATLMRGRDGTDTSYETDTVRIGPGEAFDVMFTAPNFAGSSGLGYDSYVLYNRRLTDVSNLTPDSAAQGFSGQRTEIRVYPSGVNSQRYPNDWGM
jgi:hypothetical protein